MSYRIYAFHPVAGVDPLETGREIAFGSDDEEPAKFQKDENSPDLDLGLASTLKRRWPDLQEVRFDPTDLAAVQGSTSDTDPISAGLFLIEPKSGVRIALEDGIVTVWTPLSLAQDSLQAVFTQIWGCLEVLERERGYAAYDPHLDRILFLPEGMPATLVTYRKWSANDPSGVRMDSVLLNAELVEDGLLAEGGPWYSAQ